MHEISTPSSPGPFDRLIGLGPSQLAMPGLRIEADRTLRRADGLRSADLPECNCPDDCLRDHDNE